MHPADLIVAKVAAKMKAAEDGEEARVTALRDELGKMKRPALKKRALEEGATARQVGTADDSDDPRKGVTELLMVCVTHTTPCGCEWRQSQRQMQRRERRGEEERQHSRRGRGQKELWPPPCADPFASTFSVAAALTRRGCCNAGRPGDGDGGGRKGEGRRRCGRPG